MLSHLMRSLLSQITSSTRGITITILIATITTIAVVTISTTICCRSVAQLCPALCDPMDCSTPGFPALHHLLEFVQTHAHCIDGAIQTSHPLLPLLLRPSIFHSIRVFSNELALCIRWPKYWSLSFSPSSEYSGLISFRIDWFDLFAVQGTLKDLLQHCNLKASIL